MVWDLVEKREWVRGRERFTNFGSWSVGENEALATGYDLERERGGGELATVGEWDGAEGKIWNLITHESIVFIEPHLIGIQTQREYFQSEK